MADIKYVIGAVDQTKAAIESAKRNMASLGGQAQGMLPIFGTLGGAIAAAFTATSLKGAVDMLDKLDDMSEKTGIAVESLSALRYAGEVTGTPLEAIATGVKKLSMNMAEAAGGNKEAAATFQALGVSVKNADGSLRSQDALLMDLADRFAGFKDGAGKAALAQKVFGKSGADMIPLLNQGSAGIKRLREEAEALGLVYGGEQAKAAAEFNDNLTKLGMVAEAAKVSIASELIPGMTDLIGTFVSARRESGLLMSSLIALGGAVSKGFGLDDQGTDQRKARMQSNAMQLLGRQIELMAPLAERGDAGAKQRLQSLRTQLEALQKEALQTSESLKKRADEAYAEAATAGAAGGAKQAPPGLSGGDDSAAKKAENELKAQARLLAELSGLSGSFAEDWQRLSALYGQGKLDLQQLTQAQAELLSRQPAIREETELQTRLQKERNDAIEKATELASKSLADMIAENEQRAQNNQRAREELEEIGLTTEKLNELRLARMNHAIALEQENLLRAQNIEGNDAEVAQIERRIRLMEQERDTAGRRAQAQEKEDAKQRTQTLADSIEDGILKGFREGSSIADIFLNELKAQFGRTVLRPMIMPIAEAGNALIKTGLNAVASALGLSSFDVGTDYVTHDQIALIHKGERIVPAAENMGSGGQPVIVNQYFTVGDVASVSMVREAVAGSERRIAGQLGRSMRYGGALS